MVKSAKLKIRLITIQWATVGVCIKWQTWVTANAILGLVEVPYWRGPHYACIDGPDIGSHEYFESLDPIATGELSGFTASILALYGLNQIQFITGVMSFYPKEKVQHAQVFHLEDLAKLTD